MKIAISTALENIAKIPDRQERIAVLRKVHWENDALQVILRLAFDPNVKFALPLGEVPYRPSEVIDGEGMLYTELRKIPRLFLEGGHADLKQHRREQLFVQLLESVKPSDAKLLVAVKDKKFPYKGIDADLVREAFPGIF